MIVIAHLSDTHTDTGAAARELLTARHPLLTCPGNHDARPAYREHFLGEPPSKTPINTAHATDTFTPALCDTSVPGEDHGLPEDETFDWLSTLLAEPHPPAPS
ncbi:MULTISPECIES: hypothetical protein [Streptomyces]|uniref:hypothetical protein n=1 Tax=Streptomyces TaxID=1883 RepID=UPI00168844FC|nr:MULTISPECIES: hypothetical protein [Streptomyces]